MSKVNLKDKHLRYGGYGALLTLLVIAITIVMNIIVTNLNLKIDATSEKLYSLSDSTKQVVSGIDQPINMYVLEQTGHETDWIKEMLTNYTKLNSHIKLIYKDPVLYPAFGSSYLKKTTQNISNISDSTVIIENVTTGKFKIVPPTEFVTSGGQNSQTSITLENAITNGIGYVINDHDGAVYYTTGHNELDLSTTLNECFDKANLNSKAINLLSDKMPDSANSALIIYSPHTDFTEDEVNKVIDFLSAGGKAMIFLDYNAPELPHFNELLSYYNLAHQAGVVVEGSSSNMVSTSPAILLPNKGEHDIISNISSNSSAIVVPVSSGLKALDNGRSSVTVTPLLTTSDQAFLKKDVESSTLTKEKDDIDGPIMLSCAVEEQSGKADTKLFVTADTYLLDDQSINVAATGNASYINSALGWLLSLDTSYAIEAKTQDTYTIKSLPAPQTLMIEILAIVIIPLIVVITGISVWLKRRHL